jgi:hypothetical protein
LRVYKEHGDNMTIIDPTTNIGKLRLRVADYSSLPIFPDSVYQATLDDCDGNLPRAATKMAQYILGTLSLKTHRKLAQIEVWGSEAFKNYKDFLMLTIKDAAFMDISPIPYGSGSEGQVHPLIEFADSWNRGYTVTQSQQMAFDASISPNDGSKYGILGNGTSL